MVSRRLEVWTDSHGRARRVRAGSTTEYVFSFSTPGGDHQQRSRTTVTTTTDFFDFGVPVDVEAPPAADVYDQTDLLVATAIGPGAVRGGWRAAAQGTFAGRPWTVWFATTTNRWRCYDATGFPPRASGVAVERLTQPGAPAGPAHDGRRASCSPPGGNFGPPFAAYLAQADGDRYEIVGYLDRDVDALTLRFADGTSARAAADPTTGVVRWSGRASPRAGEGVRRARVLPLPARRADGHRRAVAVGVRGPAHLTARGQGGVLGRRAFGGVRVCRWSGRAESTLTAPMPGTSQRSPGATFPRTSAAWSTTTCIVSLTVLCGELPERAGPDRNLDEYGFFSHREHNRE